MHVMVCCCMHPLWVTLPVISNLNVTQRWVMSPSYIYSEEVQAGGLAISSVCMFGLSHVYCRYCSSWCVVMGLLVAKESFKKINSLTKQFALYLMPCNWYSWNSDKVCKCDPGCELVNVTVLQQQDLRVRHLNVFSLTNFRNINIYIHNPFIARINAIYSILSLMIIWKSVLSPLHVFHGISSR